MATCAASARSLSSALRILFIHIKLHCGNFQAKKRMGMKIAGAFWLAVQLQSPGCLENAGENTKPQWSIYISAGCSSTPTITAIALSQRFERHDRVRQPRRHGGISLVHLGHDQTRSDRSAALGGSVENPCPETCCMPIKPRCSNDGSLTFSQDTKECFLLDTLVVEGPDSGRLLLRPSLLALSFHSRPHHYHHPPGC